MASLPSHAIAALALGTAFVEPDTPKRFWIWGALLSMLPDADVIAFGFGIPYESPLGHRGFSHSLLAALLMAFLVLAGELRWRTWRGKAWRLGLYFFLAAASHGVLDAMTSGGKGVGFFIPFSDERFFFPWRPIRVSPIGLGAFFSARGLAVLVSECKWVWLPSAAFGGLIMAFKGWLAARRNHGVLAKTPIN
jgi:inner membrane protein